MILIQNTVLSTLTDKQLARYSDPKIQPFFAKIAFIDAESSQTTANFDMQFYFPTVLLPKSPEESKWQHLVVFLLR